MTKKIRRFHRDVYFPEWWQDSMGNYLEGILSGNSITFSLHSIEKIMEYSFRYGKNFLDFLVKIVRKNALNVDNVFELYADGQKIKKACFRFSFEDFPVDIVLVISADGVVITVFIINKGDNHTTLDKNLYERSF